ncbi:cation diffusion facilitator family transporter [Microlunatus sp. Gsoil 973]|uniref:cation diffusion facilitator family transporter n=1 Tax=Microlunatus sp. Gsoil 973 TaxID=2672569 RepID=UPI0012B4F35A|nr:cation diffusion facilitator family transporter [Microlunatus sp. Gsoil 973]QGN32028.1 cation diffusion facilitator family transporter [Microlunatus sp. Gsoil 973]
MSAESTPLQQPTEDQGSLTTVLIAFGANLLIAVAKTIAAMITSSASMVAEAAHSWADTGNEVLLLIADRSGRRGRDDGHPLGYGRDSYVWSMFAAFGLFTAGAVVSIMHGFQQLFAAEPGEHFLINYIVLAIAFVLEGTSFVQAFRQARGSADDTGAEHTLEYVLDTSNPTLRAVFFEDAAALIGVVLAATGIAAHQLTGSPVPDALGSIAVGILLGVIAVVLIQRNRNFLLGQQISPELRRTVLRELLAHPDVERITYLHVEFVGPSRVYLVAAVDLTGNEREHDLAVRLRGVERDLEGYAVIEEAVLTLATQDEPALEP